MCDVGLSAGHYFSIFQRETHTIVVLDTAWPWTSEAYGTCRLCAYFCTHKLIRSRSFYRSLLQARYKVNSGAGYYLAWANNTYGLCCLRAYFCAHTVIRARSYEVTHQKGIGIAMGFLLQKRMNWLRALFERVSVLVLWSWVLVL